MPSALLHNFYSSLFVYCQTHTKRRYHSDKDALIAQPMAAHLLGAGLDLKGYMQTRIGFWSPVVVQLWAAIFRTTMALLARPLVAQTPFCGRAADWSVIKRSHDWNWPIAARLWARSCGKMSSFRKQTPSEFLKQIIGKPVVVKLNSGVDYRGKRIICIILGVKWFTVGR